MKTSSLIVALFSSLLIVACGGSSDSSDQSTPAQPEQNFPNLPRVEIFELESPIQDEPKVTARMTVTEFEGDVVSNKSYDGFIGVEYRGSSSQLFYDKKGFGIETRDSEGEDLDAEILGFPEEEDWVLHGPYGDKSLIRNALMFDIGEELSFYSSRWEFVDLYIEGEYHGLYLLLEKIKRDKNRVDVNKLKDDENEGEDLTGGYILKLDKTTGENIGGSGDSDLSLGDIRFKSEYASTTGSSSIYFIYDYPKPEDITNEQKQYIQDYVNDFESALIGEEFDDEELGYENFINVETFVDYFLATELSGNVDGYRLSTYLFKDKNDKLSMGPLWDYNLAFGNAAFCRAWETDYWVFDFEATCPDHVSRIPFWWSRLLEDQNFVDKVKARWSELRAGGLSDESLAEKIDSKVNYLNEHGAVAENFQRWDILGTYVWPNYFVGDTHAEEIDFLKKWVDDRVIWLDSQISNL